MNILRWVGLLLVWLPTSAAGRICTVPDGLRASTPDASPPRTAYEPVSVGSASAERISLGVGHLHYSLNDPVVDLPPGEENWLQRIALPLSRSAGGEPSAAILRGWVVGTGGEPEVLSTLGMVETGYEEASFVVLERRSDGWLRIRYGAGATGERAAWTPTCALAESPAQLDFTAWGEWFMSDRVSPLHSRFGAAVELRSEPSPDAAPIASVAGDFHLEPLELRGSWMRARTKEPSDYCRPDTRSRSEEGWVRWSTPEDGPILWYYTRGC